MQRNALSASGSAATVNGATEGAASPASPARGDLAPGAELPSVFDDEGPGLRPHPVEESLGDLPLVVHHEQPGARRVQPAEARVRGPGLRLIVVLHQRLDEDTRREEVTEAGADQRADEIALIEVYVVVVQEQRRRERRAVPIDQRGAPTVARAVVERTKV